MAVKILSVKPASSTKGLWIIRGDDGERYATKDELKASICERAHTLNMPVEIMSRSGFYYREIITVAFV